MNSLTPYIPSEEDEETNKIEIRELTLRHGLGFPSEEELIMLILGSGTKQMPIKALAHQVLGIVMASNAENLVENLIKIKGMGKSKALMIAAALEFGRRFNRTPQVSLAEPSEIIPYIQSYAMQKQEHFLCVSLNGAREIISIRVVCSGAGNMTIIRPADVFAEAIKEHASAVVISHNHPNGNPAPSKADVRTTKRLYQAAELLGIALLDHIIISRTGYYSFLEHGFFEEETLFDLL